METTTKVCTKCKVEKSCDNFSNDKTTKDGLRYWCKQCVKKYNQDNIEKHRELNKKYHQANAENRREQCKKWREVNADLIKKYRQDNFEKIAGYNRKRKQENPAYFREYEKKRRQSDPIYRMIGNIRTRIYLYCQAIKANKTTRTKEMLGLDLAGFKLHIESKFQEGMTWDNYGQWHIDHIKPISLATTEQEIIELNHYTNLQPLWAVDNIKKSNKYEESH